MSDKFTTILLALSILSKNRQNHQELLDGKAFDIFLKMVENMSGCILCQKPLAWRLTCGILANLSRSLWATIFAQATDRLTKEAQLSAAASTENAEDEDEACLICTL